MYGHEGVSSPRRGQEGLAKNLLYLLCSIGMLHDGAGDHQHTLRDIVSYLDTVYCGPIGLEVSQVLVSPVTGWVWWLLLSHNIVMLLVQR